MKKLRRVKYKIKFLWEKKKQSHISLNYRLEKIPNNIDKSNNIESILNS